MSNIDDMPMVHLNVAGQTTVHQEGAWRGLDWNIYAQFRDHDSCLVIIRMQSHDGGLKERVANISVNGCGGDWEEPQKIATALLWDRIRTIDREAQLVNEIGPNHRTPGPGLNAHVERMESLLLVIRKLFSGDFGRMKKTDFHWIMTEIEDCIGDEP